MASDDDEFKLKPETEEQLSSRCPNCSAQMTEKAVLCIECGYDTRTGGQIEQEGGGKLTPDPNDKSRCKICKKPLGIMNRAWEARGYCGDCASSEAGMLAIEKDRGTSQVVRDKAVAQKVPQKILDRRESFPSPPYCWYCKSDPPNEASAEHSFAYEMTHREDSEKECKVIVPRCKRCAASHASTDKIFSILFWLFFPFNLTFSIAVGIIVLGSPQIKEASDFIEKLTTSLGPFASGLVLILFSILTGCSFFLLFFYNLSSMIYHCFTFLKHYTLFSRVHSAYGRHAEYHKKIRDILHEWATIDQRDRWVQTFLKQGKDKFSEWNQ